MSIGFWVIVGAVCLALLHYLACLRANRCPKCRKWFGLRATVDASEQMTQEHFDQNPYNRHHKIGETVTSMMVCRITCRQCPYQRFDAHVETETRVGEWIVTKMVKWMF